MEDCNHDFYDIQGFQTCVLCGLCKNPIIKYTFDRMEDVPYFKDSNWTLNYKYNITHYIDRLIRQFTNKQRSRVPKEVCLLCKKAKSIKEVYKILKNNKLIKYFPYRFNIFNSYHENKIQMNEKIANIIKDIFNQLWEIYYFKLPYNERINKKKFISINFCLYKILDMIYEKYGKVNGQDPRVFKKYIRKIKGKKIYNKNEFIFNKIINKYKIDF